MLLVFKVVIIHGAYLVVAIPIFQALKSITLLLALLFNNIMTQITIPANKWWFPTGIILVGGTEYQFAAQGTWHDDYIICGPEGYTLQEAVPKWKQPFFRLLQGFRPQNTGDRWFQLIGKVGDSIFEIGTGLSCLVPVDGELFCTANDVPFMFWNNKGELTLNVIQAAGQT
jgi:hypothetical protein